MPRAASAGPPTRRGWSLRVGAGRSVRRCRGLVLVWPDVARTRLDRRLRHWLAATSSSGARGPASAGSSRLIAVSFTGTHRPDRRSGRGDAARRTSTGSRPSGSGSGRCPAPWAFLGYAILGLVFPSGALPAGRVAAAARIAHRRPGADRRRSIDGPSVDQRHRRRRYGDASMVPNPYADRARTPRSGRRCRTRDLGVPPRPRAPRRRASRRSLVRSRPVDRASCGSRCAGWPRRWPVCSSALAPRGRAGRHRRTEHRGHRLAPGVGRVPDRPRGDPRRRPPPSAPRHRPDRQPDDRVGARSAGVLAAIVRGRRRSLPAGRARTGVTQGESLAVAASTLLTVGLLPAAPSPAPAGRRPALRSGGRRPRPAARGVRRSAALTSSTWRRSSGIVEVTSRSRRSSPTAQRVWLRPRAAPR